MIFIFLAVAFILYFIPTIVARERRHVNALAITMLNVFLGWTLIGWVIALVWACTANTHIDVVETITPAGDAWSTFQPSHFGAKRNV